MIRQNVFVSLRDGHCCQCRLLEVGPPVAMHEGSTLLVVFNALRLLAYRDSSDRAGIGKPEGRAA